MTAEERAELIEKLLSASMVTKPFTPPESYQIYLRDTTAVMKEIETSAGATRIWLVEKAGRSNSSAVMVNLHGGGFVGPHTERDTCFCRRIASELGILVVDVAYRTSQEAAFPVACYQVYDCVKWVADHAEELGCDPGKIIITGHSAGGNLSIAACNIATERQGFHAALLILDYPPTDLFTDPADKPDSLNTAILPGRARDINRLYLDDKAASENILASPILAATEQLKNLPETVLITAGKDNLRHEGEAYASKLIEAGVIVHSRRFLSSRHGFVISCMDEYDEAVCFMEKMIRSTVLR